MKRKWIWDRMLSGVREYAFMKHNIPTDVDFICTEIQDFIPFVPRRVSQKNPFKSSRRELVSVPIKSTNKAKAPKTPEVCVVRCFPEQDLKRCLLLKLWYRRGNPVNEI